MIFITTYKILRFTSIYKSKGIVCFADLASHVIICNLIRLGVMCLKGENNTSPESTALGALWKPYSCGVEVG